MTRRIAILIAAFLTAASLSGQTAQRRTTATPQRALPSASVTVSPSPAIQNQSLTVTLRLNNPPYYYGTQPPSPTYAFQIRKPDHTALYTRDFSRTTSGSWTPTAAGSYYVLGAIQLFNQDGSAGQRIEKRTDFTVSAAGLGWSATMTSATMGATPASYLNNKSLKDIVNSVVSGRPDGMKCNSCHTAGTTQRMYRPNTTQPITPTTSINRGDAYNSVYRWNMSGSSGIVEKFCTTPAGKPAELCAAFRKWAAEGFKP